MSEMTKQDVTDEILERVEFVTGFCSDGWGDVDPREVIAASVNACIALRSLRDAGDGEVERLYAEISEGIGVDGEYAGHEQFCRDSKVAAKQLRDIAIARGQQLREAREEIERLDQVVQKLKDNFGEMEVGP